MSDADDIDAIRDQKKEELRQGTAASAPDEPVHVDGEADLDDLVADHDVVLVDFYADWCGPCKMLEPIVADVAAETDAVVAKVDVDANQALAQQYRVQGIPALFLFADGEVVERLTGVQEKASLVSLVEQYA